MVLRGFLLSELLESIEDNSITAILGPRQCGKTTLSKAITHPDFKLHYFDLEDPRDAFLFEQPMLALEALTGIIIIDEIQLKPALFSLLRVLADKKRENTRFVILGSASPSLIKGASESLAGRIHFIDMVGFTLTELGSDAQQDLWMRGGFPLSYLANSETKSINWRNNFIRTFLERDIPQLGINIPTERLRKFWYMLAHYHGNILNTSEIGKSLGLSSHTIQHYLDILSGTYMIYLQQPWFENISKRQVKSPKLFIRDTGLLHALLGLNEKQLVTHPKIGASWEGFVIEQLKSKFKDDEMFFWNTHGGAELDVLLFRGGKRIGFEIKYSDSPNLSRGSYSAIEDLQLDHLYVIVPTSKTYPLKDKITVTSLKELIHLPL